MEEITKCKRSAQRSGSVKQYNYVASIYKQLVYRSYEDRYSWYYVVFKPFDDSYTLPKYFNVLGACSDYLRSKSVLGILSREVIAPKIHVNALVVSREDLLALHGKNIQKRGLKYKLHIERCETFEHRDNVLQYMFKEVDQRDFTIYLDHLSYQDTKLTFRDCVESLSETKDCTGVRTDNPNNSTSDPDDYVCPAINLFNCLKKL